MTDMRDIDKPNRLGYCLVMPKQKAFKTQDGYMVAIFDSHGPWWECFRFDSSGKKGDLTDLIDDLGASLREYYVPGFIQKEIKLSELPDGLAREAMAEWRDRLPAAVLGRMGGLAKSRAKASASRANGKLGGRPKKAHD